MAASGAAIRPAHDKSSTRRGDIQGLRAVAVLLVVVYHSGIGLSGGFIGVDVFFVISGYVITTMLTKELKSTGRLDLKRFYLRRIRRLLPALALMLSVVMLASVLLSSLGGQKLTARTGAAATLVNANSYLMRAGGGGYFDVSADLNALLHTWSLSVEEQFYLVFPAVLFGSWAIGRRIRLIGGVRAAASVLTLIAGLSFVLSWATTNGFSGPLPIAGFVEEFAFYSSPTRAWEFAVGGLAALGSSRLARLGATLSTTFAAAGFTLLAIAAVSFDAATAFPGTAAVLPVAGTLLVLAAGEGHTGNPLNRALALRPLQYLGDTSYSWYLWHWPCIVFAAALWPTTPHIGSAAAVASLLPALLSYRFVEGPIRFALRPPTRRTVALAFASILIPLLSAVVLVGVVRSNRVSALRYGLREHADSAMRCDTSEPLGGPNQSACTWRVENARGDAVMIGDSNAGHFTESFVQAANDLGFNATVNSLPSCPFVDLIVIRDGVKRDCRTFATESLSYMLESKPDLVVVASASDRYVEGFAYALADPINENITRDPGDKADLWVAGLAGVIDPLVAEGIDVVLIHTVPKFGDWDPRGCAVLGLLLESESCRPTVTKTTPISSEGGHWQPRLPLLRLRVCRRSTSQISCVRTTSVPPTAMEVGSGVTGRTSLSTQPTS